MKKESIIDIFESQKANYIKVGSRDVHDRKKDLIKLRQAVLAYREEILDALFKDLGKPPLEAEISDIYTIKTEIGHILKHLSTWMHPRRVRAPLSLRGTTGYIRPESKGVVLIISPWNFPFNLTLGPLAVALAAGNCVILKPSEHTPHSNKVMQKIISENFETNHVCLIEGESETSQFLTSLPFHHIFFTGSPAVGRQVMLAAAENLCSVTLELGGKNPAIIDRDSDLNDAIKRIVWGKMFNSGQVCISPDYLLVPEEKLEEICSRLKSQITDWYGESPIENQDLGCIINTNHFDRLEKLLIDSANKGAIAKHGGKGDRSKLKFEPTILINVDSTMMIMNEEIFGPVLPIITYKHVDEVNSIIQKQDRPLAYYIFSKNQANIRNWIYGSRSGTTGINETFVQFIFPGLPFGGINNSGIGKSHGQAGFETFSNLRSFVKQRSKLNMVRMIFPPYTNFKKVISRLTTKWL